MNAEEGLEPGEFWAIIHKSQAAGADFDQWTIPDLIRAFPLTPEDRAETARKHAEFMAEIQAIRSSRSA